MGQPLIAPMPPDLDLGGGFVIRLTAVDPTTGAKVPGVNVGSLVIALVDLTGGGGQGLGVGDFLLVPGPGA